MRTRLLFLLLIAQTVMRTSLGFTASTTTTTRRTRLDVAATTTRIFMVSSTSPPQKQLNDTTSTCWESTVYQDDPDDACPRGYFLNSVRNCCTPLGPLGRLSQRIETIGPLQKVYRAISNVFHVDTTQISKLGIPFLLSYAIISQINAALTLSIAWYVTCQRTGLSPLVPGQWKALLTTYGAMYALIQILRPFRVALAIGASKLSRAALSVTQEKLRCNQAVAIGLQYLLGYAVWLPLATVGILLASWSTGVPVLVSAAV